MRPGPIQGQMVHPYLRRRSGQEPVAYPGPEVEGVLSRTLGVPIFQEQVMQLAIVAAGFTPGEADSLRRAMAAWRRKGSLGPFEQRLVEGMRARGYDEGFARQVFQQILGFGEYGFPESHAASFALLVYVSAWLKRHEPAAFCCALLNSQPMGFYAPAQLVRDARAHGVSVLPAGVNESAVESTLEAAEGGTQALRLGLDRVRGLAREAAERIVCRPRRGPATGASPSSRAGLGLGRRDLGALAAAGALAGLAGHRHRAAWEVLGVEPALPLLPAPEREEGLPLLRSPTEGEDIVADYRALGLTLARHPLALLRPRLAQDGWLTAAEVADLADGAPLRTGGIVVTRQRPGSAGGVIFVTLEDETGYVNLVVWSRIADAHRKAMLGARLLGVRGRLQREGEVRHVVVDALEDRSALLGSLTDEGEELPLAPPGSRDAAWLLRRAPRRTRRRRSPRSRTGGPRCAFPRACVRVCARQARRPRRGRHAACGYRNPASTGRRRGPPRLPRFRPAPRLRTLLSASRSCDQSRVTAGRLIKRRGPRPQGVSAHQLIKLEDWQQERDDDHENEAAHQEDHHRPQDADRRIDHAVELAFLVVGGTLEHRLELAAGLAARDQVDQHRGKQLARAQRARDRGALAHAHGGVLHGAAHGGVGDDLGRDPQRLEDRHGARGQDREGAGEARGIVAARDAPDERQAQLEGVIAKSCGRIAHPAAEAPPATTATATIRSHHQARRKSDIAIRIRVMSGSTCSPASNTRTTSGTT